MIRRCFGIEARRQAGNAPYSIQAMRRMLVAPGVPKGTPAVIAMA